MNIARIDADTSRVVNIEVATLEWIKENADPNGPFLFVPSPEDRPAWIGLGWEPIGGFEQPISKYDETSKERPV
jgi:hypothetical protein